jgi:hypothetical protein
MGNGSFRPRILKTVEKESLPAGLEFEEEA